MNAPTSGRVLGLIASVNLIAIASPAVAQEQQRQTEPEEIIVTAQKREERVQDIPFTINVLNEESLLKNRVQNLADVARRTPGLEIGAGFGRQTSSVVIRGVGPQTYNSPTVVTFVDGFTTGLRIDVTGEIFDLERVEVLKGPQATLYGRNAIGGTINYVTKKPSADWEGRIEGSFGNYDAITLRGGVSGPIAGETLTFRAAGSFLKRDGFFDNIFDGTENVDGQSDRSGRLALRLAPPGSIFESNLAVSFTRSKDDCGDCIQRITGFPAVPTAASVRALDVNRLDGVYNQDFLGGFDRKVTTAVFTNTLDLGNTNLTSISGYSHVRTFSDLDFNRGPGPLDLAGFIITSGASASDVKVMSQEIRLSSSTSGPFQWLAGLYYYDANDGVQTSITTPFGLIPTGSIETTTRNYAAFFNGSYELADQLTLGFGLRYDIEKTRQLDLVSGADMRTKATEWLPRASLLYALTPSSNIYATISRGYHSGGLNSGPTVFGTPPEPDYGPEYVWNYEIGYKGGSRSFNYQVAGFFIDWTDQQVSTVVPGSPLTYLVNAGKTRIYGIEGSLNYELTQGLTIDVAANWTHARYREFLDESGIPNLYGFPAQRRGARPIQSPEFSGSATVEYISPLSANWDLQALVSGRYTGTRSIDNLGILVAGGFATVDASLALESGNTRLSLFGSNLFDKSYATYAQLFAGFVPLIRPGDPRTYGVRIEYKF